MFIFELVIMPSVSGVVELTCFCVQATLEFGAAQLRSVTVFALKLPFLCVNRSPIRYGFRVGAKAAGGRGYFHIRG